MPIIEQKWITRQDLRNNRHQLYVFGDNVLGQGYGGQAKEMRGEINAIGVPTKWEPKMRPESFFRDNQINDVMVHMEEPLLTIKSALQRGQTVVWPADGIGTGLSRWNEYAPQLAITFEQVLNELRQIEPEPANGGE
jgi:hypothetical protein